MSRAFWRRQGAAAGVALGFVAATTAPVFAAPADQDDPCAGYGTVAQAPEGMIPRDDFIKPTKDPLAGTDPGKPGKSAKRGEAAVTAEAVTIPVVFHVISKDGTVAGGNVPDSQIAAQIAVLNEAYAGTGFSFVLEEVTRTVKPSWFNLISTQGGTPRFFRGSGKEIKMKQELHTGDAQTLNLYSSSLGQHLLGWAYFPFDFGEGGLPRFYDGVVVDYRSLPGGSFSMYNEGDTATHEIGHWLGLFHTFDNGCSEPGDFVEDTPYEASPSFLCEERDTCAQPGSDPIHNFMDYSPDACMSEFTAGQADRMQEAWARFRS